jgi:hypothetical protein
MKLADFRRLVHEFACHFTYLPEFARLTPSQLIALRDECGAKDVNIDGMEIMGIPIQVVPETMAEFTGIFPTPNFFSTKLFHESQSENSRHKT